MTGFNGLEMLLKTFGLDPAEMKNTVEQFRQMVLRLAVAVEHVEAQQRAIMAHMGINPVNASTEPNHGRPEIASHNGNADTASGPAGSDARGH